MTPPPVREEGVLFKRILFAIVASAPAFFMKTPFALCAAALLLTLPNLLWAQENPVPAPAAKEPLPQPVPDSVPFPDSLPLIPQSPERNGKPRVADPTMPVPDSIPLIPESPERTVKPKGSRAAELEPEKPSEKKNKTEVAETDMKERIRMRQLKTRALNEPALQSEWQRAQSMRTDATKRDALRNYYRLLYARMTKLDPTIKKRIDTELSISLRRLSQDRLNTSEALDPRERLEQP